MLVATRWTIELWCLYTEHSTDSFLGRTIHNDD